MTLVGEGLAFQPLPAEDHTPMATPLIGSPYCSAGQFLTRYDYRTVGQLLKDDDSKPTRAQVEASTDLQLLLGEASGKLEAAVMMGGKYSIEDLASLGGNGQEFVAGLIAHLTMPLVYRRRPTVMMPAMPQVEEAERILNALAEGKMVLPILENVEAGRMTSEVETPAIVEARHMTTFQARRLFGVRGNRRT